MLRMVQCEDDRLYNRPAVLRESAVVLTRPDVILEDKGRFVRNVVYCHQGVIASRLTYRCKERA